MSELTTELAKLLVSKLADVKLEDAVKAAEVLRRATAGASSAFPPAALIGTGVLVGVGVGLLVAPRTGAEARAALKDRWQRLRGGRRGVVVTVGRDATAEPPPATH